MSHLNRFWCGTIVLACLSMAPFAEPPSAARFEREKTETVRAVLRKSNRLEAGGEIAEGIRTAAAVLAVEVNSLQPRPSVTLEIEGTATPVPRYERGGLKLVVDLYDAIVVPKPRVAVIDGNRIVAGARIYLSELSPRMVTTLEVDLMETASFDLRRQGDSLVFSFTGQAPGQMLSDIVAEAIGLVSHQYQLIDKEWDRGGSGASPTDLHQWPLVEECGELLASGMRLLQTTKEASIQNSLEKMATTAASIPHARSDRVERALRISQDRLYTTQQQFGNVLQTDGPALRKSRDGLRAFMAAARERLDAARNNLNFLQSESILPEAYLQAALDLMTEIRAGGKSDALELERLQAHRDSIDSDLIGRLDTIKGRLQSTLEGLGEPGRVSPYLRAGAAAAQAEWRARKPADDRLANLTAALDTIGKEARTEVASRLQALDEALEKVKANDLSFDLDDVEQEIQSAALANELGRRPAFARGGHPPAERNSRSRPANRVRFRTLMPSPSERPSSAGGPMIILAQEQTPQEDDPVVSESQTVVPEEPPAAPPEPPVDSGPQTVLTEPGTFNRAQGGIREIEGVTLAKPAAAPQSTPVRPPSYTLYNPELAPEDDPLRQKVNIDFQEMEIANIVKLLAESAGGLNVIAGTEVSGRVSAYLVDIPLGQAIETVLRTVQLGIVQEAGVWRITTYEEAVASRRERRIVTLTNGSATDMVDTLNQVLSGTSDGALLSVTANESTNTIILVGPLDRVREFVGLIADLDTSEPVIPTETIAISLNYSDPIELVAIIQPLLSDGTGQVSPDSRSRILVVTDLPNVVEQIKELVEELDKPVKQVGIEAMIVDAVINDTGSTGVDWILNLVRRNNSRGDLVGNVAQVQGSGDFTGGGILHNAVTDVQLGGQLLFATLSGDFDLRTAVAAEVRSENATLLASPFIVTVENKLARSSIAEEIPFTEVQLSATGPAVASTEFKEVGTILEVTPQVTNDGHIIVDLIASQSDTKGESVTGVPIEDRRQTTTTLRLRDGQTIYIGGLRRFDDESTVRKVPFLGDIPVLNLLFRNQSIVKERLELMIFLTCNVIGDTIPDLSPYEKSRFDMLGAAPERMDATRAIVQQVMRPGKFVEPFYKWRRKK